MSKKNILIVEDEIIVAKDLQHRLKSLGYLSPAIALTGDQALEKAAELKPDLVLMDIKLKGHMDGIEAADSIYRNLNIPVIFLTAFSDDETLSRAKLTSAFGYLLKPFDERELYIAIEMALYKHLLEKELKQNQLWLATTLRSIGDGIIVTGAGGAVEFLNPSAEKLTGWDQADARGRDLKEIFKIADNQSLNLYESITNGSGLAQALMTAENRVIINTKQNHNLAVSYNINLIREEPGTVSGAVLVLRDIHLSLQAEEDLRESELKFRALAETSPLGIAIHTGDKLIYANTAMEHILGYGSEELLKMHFWEFIHPEFQELVKHRGLSRIKGDDIPSQYEVQAVTKDGQKLWVEFGAGKITLQGKPAVVFSLWDITARKQIEEQLFQSRNFYFSLFEEFPALIWRANSRGKFDYFNKTWLSFRGRSLEQELGEDWTAGVHEEDRPRFQRAFKDAFNHKIPFEIEFRLLRFDNEYRWMVSIGTPFKDAEGQFAGYIGSCYDINESKELKESLVHMAHHDALTGLPNRVLFYDHMNLELARALRYEQKLAVMLLDLDRFKEVNDAFGHNNGDLLLQSVSKRLLECVRKSDTVSRMGGDEFTLLFPDIKSLEDIAATARKILDAFAQSFKIGQHEFHVTPSVGISIFPTDGEDAETLLKHADIAMYRAKGLGRNNYQFFDKVLSADAAQKLILKNNLRKAFEKQEFLLYYQPQYLLSNRKLIGMEALVRWQHPQFGLIPPMQFIPLAEETGLIIPLSDWVLRTACQYNLDLQKAGYAPIRVAVNLSAYTFRQHDLRMKVAEVLEEVGLEPQYLELEISEFTAAHHLESTITAIKQLRDLGVHISIDDFGTGFSSLNAINKIPADALKIDRTFVQDMLDNTHSAALVKAIIAIAHTFNLKVIAEGIETVEQLKFLKSLRCDAAQGYIFSRPVPAAEFEMFMKKDASSPA